MIHLRRRLARALWGLAFFVSPDEPVVLNFKTVKPIDTPISDAAARALADVVVGEIGGNVGLRYTKPNGDTASY